MSANEIIPGLWVGDADSALDARFFSTRRIGAVVNCTPDIPMQFRKHGVNYFHVNLDDSLKKKDIDKMIKYMPSAIKFIHDQRKLGRNVLIHCHAGMQRSAAIAVAYLSTYHGMTLNQAISLVVHRRPVAFHHGKHVNFSDALFHYARPMRRK